MPEQDGEKNLKVTKPRETAAGLTAIKETMTNAFGKMGVVHGCAGS
jgi:hypothetical protein